MHTKYRILQLAGVIGVPWIGSLTVFFGHVLLFEEDDFFCYLFLHVGKQFDIKPISLI